MRRLSPMRPMDKSRAIAGGLAGAVFSGLAIWAFNYHPLTYTNVCGYNIPSGVGDYSWLAAIFAVFAIIGFVLMVVELSHRPDAYVPDVGHIPREPTAQAPAIAPRCPVCGEPIQAGWAVCPRCEHRFSLPPAQEEPRPPPPKVCPSCSSLVASEARICPYCREQLRP